MKGKLTFYIDGREITYMEGQTILEAAAAHGIEIPALCHDERVKAYGACGLCVVEAENNPKLLRACATAAQNGIKIKTNTSRVLAVRHSALELLLSDHKGDCIAPCKAACPAHTDCQGYIGLIANGEYEEAAALVKEKLPFPASIGRVCPRPCESKCRRALVDEPVNIAGLKAFAAEFGGEYQPEIKPLTGKHISIIGGGPGGLTAAYFLRAEGHSVTVYDAMPKMGGMLRYGVPEYRLPKAILDKEIAAIERMGVKFINNSPVGSVISLSDIRANSDAVVAAIGAWGSARLNCPGEDLKNVVGGIEFLRDIFAYENIIKGKRVAVVGGGDTAMDACRTAVRLGAAEVYDIYRRSLSEMPANKIEITEAAEEGVIFKYLHNPIEILGGDSVTHMRLQKMELGVPDADGRRAPVPIPGAEELLPVDVVIVMIGQTIATEGFGELSLTKKGTIAADEQTFETNLPGVFAVGDAVNKGPGIAIEAIGGAARCAKIVHEYLITGSIMPPKIEFVVTDVKTAEDFKTHLKEARSNEKILSIAQRRDNFKEVNEPLSEVQAQKEAMRCLECGCGGFFECKLYKYANDYNITPQKYYGDGHGYDTDASSPYIYLDMNKCILCGLCVRVCSEVMGSGILGLINRGFDTVVKPELNRPLVKTNCIVCGQCAAICPTGAIGERTPFLKHVPLRTKATESICGGCGTGCAAKIHTRGRLQIKNTPAVGGLLCGEGRFGFIKQLNQTRVETPLTRKDGVLCACSFDEAISFVSESLSKIAGKYGKNAVGVSVSDQFSNEEISAITAYAKKKLETENIFTFSAGQNEPVDENASGPITQIKAGVNSRGLADAGIRLFNENYGSLKALVMFGGDTGNYKLPDVEFLTVIDAFIKGWADFADCVLPAAAFYETSGTYTNISGVLNKTDAALKPLAGRTNIDIINFLAKQE